MCLLVPSDAAQSLGLCLLQYFSSMCLLVPSDHTELGLVPATLPFQACVCLKRFFGETGKHEACLYKYPGGGNVCMSFVIFLTYDGTCVFCNRALYISMTKIQKDLQSRSHKSKTNRSTQIKNIRSLVFFEETRQPKTNVMSWGFNFKPLFTKPAGPHPGSNLSYWRSSYSPKLGALWQV